MYALRILDYKTISTLIQYRNAHLNIVDVVGLNYFYTLFLAKIFASMLNDKLNIKYETNEHNF